MKFAARVGLSITSIRVLNALLLSYGLLADN
jgi:hypothetical protein